MAKKSYIGVMNFEERKLPAGFTQVECIIASGTQYIDTGFAPNGNSRIEIDFEITEMTTYPSPFGTRNDSNQMFWVFVNTTNSTAYNFRYGSTTYTASGDSCLKRHEYGLSKEKGFVGGTEVTITASEFQAKYNLYLFGVNGTGTLSYPTSGKLYTCQIYDNDTLVRDFVPCINPDGAVGLYDLVNGEFYGNAGTGTFTAGSVHKSVAEEIPKGYIGVNGVARRIKKVYIGDENGVAKECWSRLEIVPWATGTDEQIVAMVEAADRGEINLADYWTVGDTRTVSLSAMSATGVNESHSAQSVELVLMHAGGYKLNKATANGRTTCSFVVGMKNALATKGYMNSSADNSGSWNGSARRTWCNSIFYNAVPSSLRSIFKQFKTTTAKTYNGTSNQTSVDYFAFPAAKEVYGSGHVSNSTEANALFQFDWYKTTANHLKKQGTTGSLVAWWTRSPCNYNDTGFCVFNTSGSMTNVNASSSYGLSPFGCI